MVGDEGMGIVHSPLQYFHVPFASRANLMLRRHLENSGPADCAWSIGTPGRRGDVNGSILSVADDSSLVLEAVTTEQRGTQTK